jgi:S1-C subfamily serine protease
MLLKEFEMRKFILFLLMVLMFMMSITAGVKKSIYDFEKETKGILNTASPSIVKVVAENHRKHIATGIIITKSHILSNIKVIKYNYNKIYIETKKGKKLPVKLIGKDKRTGLILLEHKNKILTPLKKGKVSETGDWVVLIGAFFDKIPAIYNGIVSTTSKDELILNAPIPPGGIGSAVLNRNGNLVGIVRGKIKFSSAPSYTLKSNEGNVVISSKRSRGGDLCYAVPVHRMNNIVTQLKKFGKVKWGWLGVNIDSYKKNKGVLITKVYKDSPASKSELKRNDIIININNKGILTQTDLQRAIRRIIPGNVAEIKALRNGKEISYTVKIGETKISSKNIREKINLKNSLSRSFTDIGSLPRIDINKWKVTYSGTPKLGVYTRKLKKKDIEKFNSKKNYGLLITGLTSNGAAKKYGMREWDILLESNGKKIKSANDLRSILKKSKPKRKTPFTISRNGKIKTIYVVPKHNYSFNNEFLKESLKDISILFSDESDIKNSIIEKELQEKILALKKKERYLSAKDKKKIEKEIYLIKKKKKKILAYEYKKLKAELIKISRKLKTIEKELNK